MLCYSQRFGSLRTNEKIRLWFDLLLSLTFVQLALSTANFRAKEKELLDSILGQQYDNRIRPSGENSSILSNNVIKEDGPCIVRVNIFVRSISRIDDVTMEYATQITFREEWRDTRLVFDSLNNQIKFLVLTDPEKIWKPDLFFANEKKGHFHNIIMPNVLLRIFPNGDVLYSIRISLVLFCPMNLKYFPLDIQTCVIQMASYGYTTEDLDFMWKETGPVQITKQLHLPRFTLIKFLPDLCTSKTTTGTYSCLRVKLLFKREFSYYLFLIYVPCCMLVIVSWVSFWIDPNSAAARVTLGITCLLTMSRQISGINASLPPVSYTKAVDVWTGFCLIFVFGALIEFSVVNYVSRTDASSFGKGRRKPRLLGARRKYIEPGRDSGIDSDDIDEMGMIGRGDGSNGGEGVNQFNKHHPAYGNRMCQSTFKGHKVKKRRNFFIAWFHRFPTRSKRIDVVSRICFPLLFACFNSFYWINYLFRDELINL